MLLEHLTHQITTDVLRARVCCQNIWVSLGCYSTGFLYMSLYKCSSETVLQLIWQKMVSSVFESHRTVLEAKSLWEDTLLMPNRKNDLAILDRSKLNDVFIHVFRFKMVTLPLVILVIERKVGFILCRMQGILQYFFPSVSAKTVANVRFFVFSPASNNCAKVLVEMPDQLRWNCSVFLSGDVTDKRAASPHLSVLVK